MGAPLCKTFLEGAQPPDEFAVQHAIFTRKGVERIIRYGFQQARRRPRKRLASATKSNAMNYSMKLRWFAVGQIFRCHLWSIAASEL